MKALEAFDMAELCRVAIMTDGAAVKGSRRQPRAHPLFTALHSAEMRMQGFLKLLNLDLEPADK